MSWDSTEGPSVPGCELFASSSPPLRREPAIEMALVLEAGLQLFTCALSRASFQLLGGGFRICGLRVSSTHLCSYMYIYMYTYTNRYTYVIICIYAYTYIYTHTRVHAYTLTAMCLMYGYVNPGTGDHGAEG